MRLVSECRQSGERLQDSGVPAPRQICRQARKYTGNPAEFSRISATWPAILDVTDCTSTGSRLRDYRNRHQLRNVGVVSLKVASKEDEQ
jgi:hypothetical protein